MSAGVAAAASPSPLERLTLSRVSTDRELEKAAAFRRQVFLERRQVVFDELLEARRDRAGHVLLLFEDGVPVATSRVLPHPSPLSPVLDLAPVLARHGVDSEVGRIATLTSPSAVRYSLVLLTLGAIWLRRHTRLERYLAYCHPKLVDLYRSVGAEDTGLSCLVPGRSDPHRIICGAYEDAARLGARSLGIAP